VKVDPIPMSDIAGRRDGLATRPRPRSLRDTVLRLGGEGRLTGEEVGAAVEIRAIWEALSRALFARSRIATTTLGVRSTVGRPRTPFDGLGRAEEFAWRRCYKPWADEMSVEVVAGVRRTTRLQIALDIVVDNRGIRAVETAYRLKHGTAVGHLAASLRRYVEIAEDARRHMRAIHPVRPSPAGDDRPLRGLEQRQRRPVEPGAEPAVEASGVNEPELDHRSRPRRDDRMDG